MTYHSSSSLVFSILLFNLFITLFSSQLLTDFTKGSCQNFTTITNPKAFVSIPCASVVDYNFFVPQGHTILTLNNLLRAKIDIESHHQIPSACKTQILRNQCSTVFLKCHDGVDLNDVSTYNTDSQLGVIPFTRPCLTNCQATAGACSTDPYTLVIGSPTVTTCTGTSNFNGMFGTPLPLYTTGLCHTPKVVDTNFIGTAIEDYAGNICKPFVSTQVFLPPVSSLTTFFPGENPSYYLPKNFVQLAIESKIASSLPVYLDGTCRELLLRKLCNSIFFKSESKTLGTVLADNELSGMAGALPPIALAVTFKIPNYPERSFCTEFNSQCPVILSRTDNILIKRSCDAQLDNGSGYFFPLEGQSNVVTVTSLPSNPGVTLSIKSQANSDRWTNQTAFSYTIDCPFPFVVPDDPNDPENQIVNGSGCAIPCFDHPAFLPDEWDTLWKSAKVFPIISIIFGVIFLTYLFIRQKALNNPLVLIYVGLALMASLVSIAINAKDKENGELEDAFCENNAVNMMDQTSQCAAQAGILVYTFLGCALINFYFAFDYFLSENFDTKVVRSPIYRSIKYATIAILPLGSVIYASSKKILGFSKTMPFCFVLYTPWAKRDLDIDLTAIPVIICFCAAFLFFLINMTQRFFNKNYIYSRTQTENIPKKIHTDEVEISNEEQNVSELDEDETVKEFKKDGRVRSNKTVNNFFVFFSIAIFLPFIVQRFNASDSRDKVYDSIASWAQCLFANYTGNIDNATAVCGESASYGPILNMVNYQTLIITSNLILFVPGYLLSELIYKLNKHFGHPIREFAKKYCCFCCIENYATKDKLEVELAVTPSPKKIDTESEGTNIDQDA